MAVIVMVIVIVEKILPILPISSGDFFSFFILHCKYRYFFLYLTTHSSFFEKTYGENIFRHKQQIHKTLSTTPKNKRLQIPLELAVVCLIIYNVLVQFVFRIK